MTEEITSLQNPRVKNWRALQKSRTQRLTQGLFITEGEHMAQEAVKENFAAALLVCVSAKEKYQNLTDSFSGDIFYVSDKIMESVCDTKTPQGIAALCRYPANNAPEGKWLVALDGVQDPGNVGTILRTMDAAGFRTLLMDEKTADPYASKALRASMGSVFRVHTIRTANLARRLAQLAEDGFAVIAGDLKGEPFFERKPFPDKVCLIIGNEGSGISDAVKAAATRKLKLPMMGGAESLNAAVAGSIMMYDVLREHLISSKA